MERFFPLWKNIWLITACCKLYEEGFCKLLCRSLLFCKNFVVYRFAEKPANVKNSRRL